MTSMQCWKPHLFSGSVFPIVGVFIPSGSSHLHQCSPHHRSSRDQGPGISTLEPGSLTWNWEVRVCASSLQVRRGLDGYVHGGLWIEVVRFPDSTIWCRNAWYMMFLLISVLQYLDRYTIYTYNTYMIIIYLIISTRKARYILYISIPECLVFTVSSHLFRTHKSSWTKLQSAILSDILQSNMSQPMFFHLVPDGIPHVFLLDNIANVWKKHIFVNFAYLTFWKVCFKFNWFEFLKGFLLGGRAINGWSVFLKVRGQVWGSDPDV